MATKLRIITFLLLPFLFIIFSLKANAAGGSIVLSPVSGSFSAGSTITTEVKIDGGGIPFNAAKATVKLQPNQNIQDLIIGNCDFSFIKTPTISDPSFVGVLLGDSRDSCIAYSLTFTAYTAGIQGITLSDGSIKAFQGAYELLTGLTDASFTITGNSQSNSISSTPITPTTAPTRTQDGQRQYSVKYSFIVPEQIDVTEVTALLDAQLPTETKVLAQPKNGSPARLSATFENVLEGVHTLKALHKGKILAEQIVNVTGDNKDIVLGSSVTPKSNTLLWIIVALILIFSGLGVGTFFVYKHYKKRTTIDF